MRTADVFVLPSYSENFGIAALEAMACGCPVVLSDQVGIHREIADAFAGLVTPCRPEELANALLAVPRRRRPALPPGSLNGVRLARQQFSLEAVSGKLVAAYSAVVS